MSRKNEQNSNSVEAKNSGHVSSPIEQLSRTLSNPTRLKILSVLSKGSKSLEAITKELSFDKKMTKPNVRKHLEKLKKVCLVFQIKDYGDYVLLAPKLTSELLEFLDGSSQELNTIFLAISETSKAYINKKFADTEKKKDETRFAFEISMDRIFKTDIFSKIDGRLRLICIKMAQMEEYDFSRLKGST